MVNKNDLIKAINELGIQKGDIVLVHSSLKSMGYVDGGAETVIDSFLHVIGEEGTLVMPTLCQKDWEHVYETWDINKPSDVGYITEVFRKMPGTLRSDQATHSVAACGKNASYITEGHTSFGPRYGMFGDYAFSHSSPWQKMYDMHGKVVFLGVNMMKNTYRHFMEYRIIEEALEKVPNKEKQQILKNKIWHYSKWDEKGVWPGTNGEQLQEALDKLGLITKSKCGAATLLCLPIFEMVNTSERIFKENPSAWYRQEVVEWLKEIY